MRKRFLNGDWIVREDLGRGDPVFYYLPAGDWTRVIGIEIDPPSEEHWAHSVTSRVSKDHVFRLASLDDAELNRMIVRLVRVLAKKYRGWTSWTTEWPPGVVDRIDVSRLESTFETAGWRRIARAEKGTFEWAR